MGRFPRHQDKAVLEFIADSRANKSVLLVEGARQVGKSFLVEHAIRESAKKWFSINLEKENRFRFLIDGCEEFKEFEQLLRDRIGFEADADQILFFDEAQESRKLGMFVRFMKEDCSTPVCCVTCARSRSHPSAS